jgi:aromatic-amino-acid transaminase
MGLIIDARKDIVMNKKAGIFAVAGRAKEAIAKHGADAVINSSLGNGMDDKGKLFIIPSFVKALKDLIDGDPRVITGYTPPGGLAALNVNYPKYILKGVDMPDDLAVRCVPTHGGSGGLMVSILNLAAGTVVSHLPYWPNYNLICKQNGRKITGFNLLDDDLDFDIADFEKVATKTSEEEGRLFCIMNSPYSNPTGSSLTEAEWLQMGEVLKKLKGEKTIVLDLAYIDFGPNGKDPADLAFLPKLFDIAPDLNVVMVPSISKAFMAYGFRLGAAILLSRDKEEADHWWNVMEGTTRGSNSNNCTIAQQGLNRVFESDELTAGVEKERNEINKVIQERITVFSEEAKKAGLKISKPTGGYFTMVYVKNPGEVAAKLEEKNVFTVPIAQPEGLRVSICALSVSQCKRLVAEIASVAG